MPQARVAGYVATKVVRHTISVDGCIGLLRGWVDLRGGWMDLLGGWTSLSGGCIQRGHMALHQRAVSRA